VFLGEGNPLSLVLFADQRFASCHATHETKFVDTALHCPCTDWLLELICDFGMHIDCSLVTVNL
jgi:hypothetical protein